MTYSVLWIFDAEAELAELWLAASDRERVTRAAQTLAD